MQSTLRDGRCKPLTMMFESTTPLLDTVPTPAELRRLAPSQLRQLADELRAETVSAVSVTGGHLGAGLGVVELTVAVHYVFDTPSDKLVWDVGHQAYPHKILTGRRDRIRSLRQTDGLSGFTKRAESEYDPFGAAHSSTSISAALGFAVAAKLAGKPGRGIAVIGDGAMSAGMAYEAMNNARVAGNRLVVILNDNDMSIAPPVGGLSAYLARLVSSSPFLKMRDLARRVARKLPEPLHYAAHKTDEFARGMAMGGTLFEELGFYYVGPIDGHNLDHLIPVLENVRDMAEGPCLVHVVTKKGHGYGPAEAAADKYHGVAKFDVVTGEQVKAKPGPPSYQNVFGETLANLADTDDRIVAITAAMPSGTGVDKFAARHPERSFDVGIAEQHAVTFAAGLAAEGMRPFCAIYSTFLQRAFDQVVHDVAIQNLPVRFAIDRAGLVGADGATHAGSFDVTYLATLPNFVVMAPADEAELVHMTYTAALARQRPDRLPLPARQRHRGGAARDPAAAGDRQGPHCQTGQQSCHPVTGHPPRRKSQGRRPAGGQGALDNRRRPALRQAARRGADPQADRCPRGRADHRGRLHRRARRACADAGQRRGPARPG